VKALRRVDHACIARRIDSGELMKTLTVPARSNSAQQYLNLHLSFCGSDAFCPARADELFADPSRADLQRSRTGGAPGIGGIHGREELG
jgi:hypothetical protein